jgi:phage terminase large subunit-like protein
MLLNSPDLYPDVLAKLKEKGEADKKAGMRWLCRHDLYFLSRYIMGWKNAEHLWLFARHREVQQAPDEHIDLWAREHGKSSIITIALTIQDILRTHGEDAEDEELTFGIFSHTRPIAKAFLSKIKLEFEQNAYLRELFPDILYDPPTAAPKWSLDSGIVVKRKRNPPEATIEAWGLVDGQPTSKHFDVLIYDDIVTLKSVGTPEQIKKTTDALSLSYNLGRDGGKKRMIGTRYHHNDSYREVIKRGTFAPRLHPCTVDGTVDGEPVLMTRKAIKEKYVNQGPYIFSAQQLLNPTAEGNQGFQESWIRRWSPVNTQGMNIYITVDPANSKNKDSDYTVMWVVGLGSDQNYYLIDGVYDRLDLGERANTLFNLHRRYRPLGVGYEQYGMQADLFYIKEKQELVNYRFKIIELGGSVAKFDRIRGLVPIFKNERFYLPFELKKKRLDGELVDIVDILVQDEYIPFPVPVHDDGLDCMARILDENLKAEFPCENKRPTPTVTPWQPQNPAMGYMG